MDVQSLALSPARFISLVHARYTDIYKVVVFILSVVAFSPLSLSMHFRKRPIRKILSNRREANFGRFLMHILQDYAESTLPSELDDYQACSEFDYKDENGKFNEQNYLLLFILV